MKTVLTSAVCAAILASGTGPAFATDEMVLMRCGASSGKAYFFNGEGWVNDGISSGKIILIGNAGGVEGNFDIRFKDAFDDVRGGYGYLDDGAVVMHFLGANGKHSFIASHGNYTDQYTFDTERNEVLWTSHKVGTIVPKVAIYYAECDA